MKNILLLNDMLDKNELDLFKGCNLDSKDIIIGLKSKGGDFESIIYSQYIVVSNNGVVKK